MTTLVTAEGLEQQNGKISIEALAKMTGFPIELIKSEIFQDQITEQEIPLEELRSAMLNFIDSTMMMSDEK